MFALAFPGNGLSVIRGRITKWFTNGSKTTVMDVIGFICESPDSSTLQFHDNIDIGHACQCSESHISSQNGCRS
jgi:hypothetical protein